MTTRTFNNLFFSILLYILTMRFAIIDFHGGDGWQHFLKSKSLLTNGYMTWNIGSLPSYFGWLPSSYPVGNQIVVSSISSICNINLEMAFMINSVFYSILGCCVLALLCFSLKLDKRTVLLSVFFFSSSLIFISSTNNNGSGRGPITSFYPILTFILFQIRYNSSTRLRFLLIFPIFLMTTASLHRMFHYVWMVCLIPTIFYLFSTYFFRNRISILSDKPKKQILAVFFLIIILLIFNQALGNFIIDPGSYSIFHYETNGVDVLFPNENFLFVLLNLASIYYEYYGYYIIFSFFILVNFLKKASDFYLLFMLSLCTLFCFELFYFPLFFISYFSIISAIGFTNFLELVQVKKQHFLIISFLLIPSLFNLEWFYSKNYSISSFLTIIGILILLFSSFGFRAKAHTYSSNIMVTFTILIITSMSFAVTLDESSNLYEESTAGQGNIYDQNIKQNSGIWQGFYFSDEKVSCESATCVPSVAYSSSNYFGVHLYMSQDDLYNSQANYEFGVYHFLETNRKFFGFSGDIGDRYDEKTAYQMIMAGDLELAYSHQITYFIFPNEKQDFRLVVDNTERDISIYSQLEDSSYVIYKGNFHQQFFFKNY